MAEFKIKNEKTIPQDIQIYLGENEVQDKSKLPNYFPGAAKVYWAKIAVLDKIVKEVSNSYKASSENIFRCLDHIWAGGSLEEHLICAKILARLQKESADSSLKFIKSKLSEVNNWAVCDVLATQGIRKIAEIKREEILELAEENSHSANKWIRRFGVVCLIPLSRIQISERMYNILENLVEDEDRDVKKGVGWVLREFTKRDPGKVLKFMKNHAKSNNPNTKWILKDGMKKLAKNIQEPLIKQINNF